MSYTVTHPTLWGEVARTSAKFVVTLDPGVTGTHRISPSCYEGVFSPPYLDLNNATTGTGEFDFTPALYGNHTISFSNTTGLSNAAPLVYMAKIQTGLVLPHVSDANVGPDWGGYLPFATGPFSEYNRPCFDDPLDPLSAGIMQRSQDLYPNRKMYVAQTLQYYGRAYCVVTGAQPMVDVVLGAYAASSDGNMMPMPDNPGVSGFVTPPTAPSHHDSHVQLIDRDNLKIYATFKTWFNLETGKWHVDHLTMYDMVHGGGGYPVGPVSHTSPNRPALASPRRMDWTTETTAGVPLMPYALRYDEACIRGEIKHAIRITTANPWNMQRYVWPGRHRNYAGPVNAGMPFGGRLRISAAWYFANRDSFGPPGPGASRAARNCLDAMYTYGVISTDGTPSANHFEIEVIIDNRWHASTQTLLRTIPVSAFEVPLMLRGISLSTNRPSGRGLVNVPVTLTTVYNPAIVHGDDNFAFNGYFSLTNGTTFRTANVVQSNLNINPTTPGNTSTWTPQVGDVGTHQLSIRDNTGNLKDAPISYRVYGAAASTYLISGPTDGIAGSPSVPFTFSIADDVLQEADVIITPGDGGAGGTFSPPTVTISTSRPPATATYTKPTAGTVSITGSNGGGLANPTALSFTAAAAPGSFIPGTFLNRPAAGGSLFSSNS